MVGVGVGQVGCDRIDHTLRDLRPSGTVEVGDRPAVLHAPERGELGAERHDVEVGHEVRLA